MNEMRDVREGGQCVDQTLTTRPSTYYSGKKKYIYIYSTGGSLQLKQREYWNNRRQPGAPVLIKRKEHRQIFWRHHMH